MPYKLSLTWVSHAKRWRKRYLCRTYYLRSKCSGRKDREGYLAALSEWERLKAFVDGVGPNPYTETGAIIPDSEQAIPVQQSFHRREPEFALSNRGEPMPSWIQSVGIGPFLHPEHVLKNRISNSHPGERRISALAEHWHNRRKLLTERGELSLAQWSADQSKLQVFRDFLLTNFPEVVFIDQISPAILNLFRDKQWDSVGSGGEHAISKVTLRKRLSTVVRWLTFLVDQNFLAELPKDLRSYAKVKLDKPKLLFFAPDEIKTLASKATERTKLYLMLALNLGFTQKDIATLDPSMIDWTSG